MTPFLVLRTGSKDHKCFRTFKRLLGSEVKLFNVENTDLKIRENSLLCGWKQKHGMTSYGIYYSGH